MNDINRADQHKPEHGMAIQPGLKLVPALLLALVVLTAGRGLLRTTPLAGHDAPAYPVNQAQFMKNLRAGTLFPRWAPDTRHGYGQPQLQFRPPLLHYMAAPVHALTDNAFLALHLALLTALALAAWGIYALARLHMGMPAALAAAAAYVCANYLISDIYLRGAYYEVMAGARLIRFVPAALLIAAALLEATPHTGGWPGPAWLTQAQLAPDAIRRHAGIPQQFYTPAWVRQYATTPAPTNAWAADGTARVDILERRPTRWRLLVAADTSARIVLAHYYYPGWQIVMPDGNILPVEPFGDMGLISFNTPPGAHELEARLLNTPARRLANYGCLAGLICLLIGLCRFQNE